MEEGNALRKKKSNILKLLEIWGKICYNTIVYLCRMGICILFALEIMEGGLDYGK